jgi:hypothetical protein
MKRTKSWITLTLVFYGLFLLWTLPAHYILSFLEKRNVLPAGNFSISGVEGAWTDGRLQEFKTAKIGLADLTWRFQPSGLIFGRLQFALTCDYAGGSVGGILRVGLQDLEIRQLQGQIPASSLAQISLPGVKLSGMVELGKLSLTAKDGYLVGGAGQLAWRNAQVDSPYHMTLGGVMVDLTAEDEGILFKLTDLGGFLQTSGLGRLDLQGKYSFDGTVGARQGSSPELTTFLQVLGRPAPDGTVKIAFKGQMARLY